MTTKRKVTVFEIASKIRAGKDFTVETVAQRNDAYKCAKIFNKEITVRPLDDKFRVIFI